MIFLGPVTFTDVVVAKDRMVGPRDLYRVYDWHKRDEWNKFISQVSDWDVSMYLDCLP